VTVRVAVLGFPIGHSRSPAMHNAAFEELGLDWRYEAIEVEPARFESLVRELPDRGFAGANVTVPHKLTALELADSASDVAQAVGAANTLSFEGDRVSADNTDVEGFLRAVRDQAPRAPAGMRALVLGAGGAARAVVYALLDQGAERVSVWNRDAERARRLVEALERHGGTGGLQTVPEPPSGGVDLLVNATSVGMANGKHSGKTPDPFKLLHISADKWEDVQLVVDLVYRDEGTALIKHAETQGITSVDGFEILVQQGAASFEIWTGRQAPLEAMRRGARRRKSQGDG
jgi:shikimate dehydrogenase